MLTEVYGHVTGQRAREARKAIQKALQFTRDLQVRPKDNPLDKGGWRYIRFKGGMEPDSDLSVTAWQLMFLRSARNAEFAVPQAYVDEALQFVRNCWDPEHGVFAYMRRADGSYDLPGRGMTAAVDFIAVHGRATSNADGPGRGDWLLAHPYRQFGDAIGGNDRFFYSSYYCSQAAMQLGGRYWEGIFPPLAEAMLSAQSPRWFLAGRIQPSRRHVWQCVHHRPGRALPHPALSTAASLSKMTAPSRSFAALFFMMEKPGFSGACQVLQAAPAVLRPRLLRSF